MKDNIIQCSLDEVLHNSMIPYAEHVIMDRALPRVEDGLKPVQRRILYAMYEMGLTPDKPHKKCAKIVGDCLGKYHPHGDSSVYDALVRMAQPFNMRMTLVNGHGNFGTVDGDTAAAYRYTEAKLEPLALELLRDIEKETVNYSLNFDDTILEPDTLPGRYPNLLVNGAMGIAVGLATNIPPHNLAEVIDGTIAYIDNEKISLKEMMKYIKGPDFPTGGYIIADNELYDAYSTGRGKIKTRAKINIESENGKENLIITEMPYQINKSTLLKKISDLKEDKKEIFSDISDVVDESDRNGMRAVIKLKKDANAKKIISLLYKHSDLECTFGINMVAIAGGKPKQMSLLEIISYYVNYQREVILRRSKYDLAKAKDRSHVLEGLIIAVSNIDEVIRIIKNADNVSDARQKLRVRFSLSEIQANAVLDLRLARLTKLEIEKLQEEIAELRKLIAHLTQIIADKKLQMEVIKEELREIRKKYKDDRRTKIVSDEKQVKIESHDDEKPILEYVLTVSLADKIKKIPLKNYKMSDKTVTEKTVISDLTKIKLDITSLDTIIFFTNLGNAIKVSADALAECKFKDKGLDLSEICTEALKTEKAVGIITVRAEEKGELLFFTKDGMIKRTAKEEYLLQKNMYQAVKLKGSDEVMSVETNTSGTTIIYVTESGMCLNAVKDDVPLQGRVSGGVKGINLADGDKIVYTEQIEDSGEIIVVTDNGLFKRVIAAEIEPSVRYRKGVKICSLEKSSKVIFGGYAQEPYELAIIEADKIFSINTEEISIDSRISKGKNLKAHKKCRPLYVTKV